jgi:hypothetical protein
MWFEYVEETGTWENQGRRRKRYNSNLEEDELNPPMPDLPGVAAEMVFVGDEDYEPDCPWKNSGMEQEINDTLTIEDWGAHESESNTERRMGLLGNRVSLVGTNEVGAGYLFT